jgi:hypothetical protein
VRGKPVVVFPERERYTRELVRIHYSEIECECVTYEHGVSPDYSETPLPVDVGQIWPNHVYLCVVFLLILLLLLRVVRCWNPNNWYQSFG